LSFTDPLQTADSPVSTEAGPTPAFGFLTNHGLVLLCIAHDPQIRMRDIAATVGITERAAQRIVADLVESGYLSRQRIGRRNLYSVRLDLAVAVPTRRDLDLNSLLNVLLPTESSPARQETMPRAAEEAAARTPDSD
jgi:DNA-binding Lrp family transcriptional regulator